MRCCKDYQSVDFKAEKQQKRYVFLLIFGILIYFFIFLPLEFFSDKNDYYFLRLFITLIILLLTGYHVISEGFIETFNNTKKNNNFTPNIHVLMTLGALGSVFFLQEFNEAILLIIIFSGANILEEKIERKSQQEIKNLLKKAPTEARLLNSKENNFEFEIIEAKKLKIGDKVLVLNGDQIPSDGIVVYGFSSVDESNITGESVPVEKKIGDKVFGSNINLENTLVIQITEVIEKNVYSQIIKLSQNIKKKISKKAILIKTLEPFYIKFIFFVTFLLFFVSFINYFFQLNISYWEFKNIFYKSVIFITVSSPCALAAADIPATLSAISNLAKKGILLKSGKILDIFSNIDVIAFDKTGTLTKGELEVKEIVFSSDLDSNQKIKYSEILLGMEQKSNHPLAFALQRYFDKKMKLNFFSDLEIVQLLGVGVEATDSNDNKYKIAKYHVFRQYQCDLKIKQKTDELLKKGYTVVYFSHNEKVLILISFFDFLRPESKDVIKYFNKNKIKTIMLTGDNEKVAQNIAKNLNLDFFVSNCLPEDKVKCIRNINKNDNNIVAMVGDGVNDAPVLAHSDVAIALKQGSDVTIDLADIVLMKNDLRKIIYTHKLSLKLNYIVWQNIVFAIIVIFLLSIINFFFPMKLPFVVIAHEASTILVILNCLRLKKDIY
ncbi:heavy metal translocating P-type ATPase [Texas Phoenix palm phytoplasma]|uniref:Heavy metal translocating P-type ATPase n=1 Tax=Texas Phoenix palm phytoplasma TaxID=176709 RepID=A0ABS5BI81_9MOLU|nr:heavy metal translocating P-type ATPase [Texas Phoenix palm phytoplasma]